MAFYPARDAAQKILGYETADRQPSTLQHHAVTVVLFSVFLVLGVSVHSLGKVYSVVGGVASSFLAYMMPALAYLGIFHPTWLPWQTRSQEQTPLLIKEGEDMEAQPALAYDVGTIVCLLFGSFLMFFTLVKAFIS